MTPSASPPNGRSETRSPMRPSSASVAGPRSSRTRDPRSRSWARRPASAGWASSADVRRARGRAAVRRTRRGSRRPVRARVDGGPERELRVGLVLLGRRRARPGCPPRAAPRAPPPAANRRRRPSDRSGRRVRPRGARRRRRRRRGRGPRPSPATRRRARRGSARRRRRGWPPGSRPAGRSGRWRCRSRRRPARREARDEPLDPRRDRSARPRRRRPRAARRGRRGPRRSRSPGRRPPGPSACPSARRRRRRDLVGRVGQAQQLERAPERRRVGLVDRQVVAEHADRQQRPEPGPRELRLDDHAVAGGDDPQPAAGRVEARERRGHALERDDAVAAAGERRVPELVRLVEAVAAGRRGGRYIRRQSGT